MNWKVFNKYFSEWFRIWQVMFVSYFLIFLIASFGGYEGDIFITASVNSLAISLVYYQLSRLRNGVILYAKRLDSQMRGEETMIIGKIEGRIEELEKQRLKEKSEDEEYD